MSTNHFFRLVAAFALLLAVVISDQAANANVETTHPGTVQLDFLNEPELSAAVQDVYFEFPDVPTGMVRRADVAEAKDPANHGKLAYASAVRVEQDLFKLNPNPLGPFPKGQPLGFTLGQYLAQDGKGTYTVNGGTAELNLSFSNLIPDGVYTLWCVQMTLPPNLTATLDPCGAPDGSQSRFDADAQGNGTYSVKTAALPDSTEQSISAIALAYHSDGKTYGPNPGDFGLNLHVPIAAILPPAPSAPSEATAGMPRTGTGDVPTGIWLALLLAGVLMVAGSTVGRRTARA